VVIYRPQPAEELSAALAGLPGLVFEAHSTDYQPASALARLVQDGVGVLKVEPGLTFALRQALYGLDQVALALDRNWQDHSLKDEVERQMVAEPRYWQSDYRGGEAQQRWLRHFSYSDRTRYYWPNPNVQAAVERLVAFLSEKDIPEPLISEFLPSLYPLVVGGRVVPRPREMLLEAVRDVVRTYAAACTKGQLA